MNILITGTTSGIGQIIAEKLHQNGFGVVGTSRNPDRVADKPSYPLLTLDVTSEESIRRCVEELANREIAVDVLINNAGIVVCGSVEETSEALAREQLETNFWGAVRLTQSILPQMRKNRRGKIIFITSLAGLVGVPYQGFYASSKHALEGFAKSLRQEVKELGISVSAVEPGFFKTNIHHAFQYADRTIDDYAHSRTNAVDTFRRSIEHAPHPDAIAKTVLRIIKATRPKYSYRVGTDAKLTPVLQFLSYRLFEWGVRRKFRLP